MNTNKNEFSLIFSFIKKNIILYISGLSLSILTIFLVILYDKLNPKYENIKTYSLIPSVPILNSGNNLLININKEITKFRNVPLSYAFAQNGSISIDMRSFNKNKCGKLNFSTLRDYEFTIKLHTKDNDYENFFKECTDKIESLVVKKKINYYKSTSNLIEDFRKNLNKNKEKINEIIALMTNSSTNAIQLDDKYYILELINTLNENDENIYYLNDMEKILNSKDLLVLEDITNKVNILDDSKDYLFILLFFTTFVTLIGFLKKR